LTGLRRRILDGLRFRFRRRSFRRVIWRIFVVALRRSARRHYSLPTTRVYRRAGVSNRMPRNTPKNRPPARA